MAGHKLLSDFYIDQKVDNQLKAKTPILCSGNEVLWVVGYRISEKIKCSSFTKNTKISFTFE
jgi:tRNA(Ile)-lysidine synthase